MFHPETPRSRPQVPPNIQLLRHNPEIVELARTVFERAQEVINRVQPLAHTHYTEHSIGPFSAKQYAFKDGGNRHEIQQSGLMMYGKQEFWDRTRVRSFIDNDLWSLSSTHHSDPASLLLTRNRQLSVPVDDARRVLDEMSRSLDSWLMSRDNDDFFARHILPVTDRLHGFIQGFSHRVSPPKD